MSAMRPPNTEGRRRRDDRRARLPVEALAAQPRETYSALIAAGDGDKDFTATAAWTARLARI